jgi:outer membrane protein OmpA-like peptidoglycan-associated protein
MARPFDEALMNAAHMLFSLTELPKPGEKHLLVIDPLIDGVSGVQSVATRIIEARILELVRSKYPYFSPQPFNEANVRKSPLVLVGTLTAVNAQGQSSGVRQAYGICLALVDLKSGAVASKGTSHAQMQGVNHTPTPYFQESPAWMRESATEAYVNTCKASKPGDPVQTAYLDGLVASTLISEAISAYENGRYKEALNRYSSALDLPSGNQLRVYNGIYLTNLKLGRQGPATDAFGKIIDYGLAKKRLAVKFLFKPGTTAFMAEKQVSSFYPMWVREIAKRATQNNSCLEVVGHSSRSGPEPLNEKLSLLRAEYVKKKLEVEAPPLAKRTIAQGAGSRENLVGNGRDDLSDALDRRVVFQVINCKDSSQYY